MEVHVRKTILMQRLMDAVIHGYVYYTSGTVPLEKAEKLCKKFDQKYRITDNSNQRYYAKTQGRSNTRLYYYATESDDKIYWWLLATKGQNEIHTQEKLQNAAERNGRIRVPGEYELLRLARPKTSGGGTGWTWRMTKETYSIWRERMTFCGRNRTDLSARKALGSLKRTPGFRGIRQQVGKLSSVLRKSWIRHHGNKNDLPGILKLPYIERTKNQTIELHELLRCHKRPS